MVGLWLCWGSSFPAIRVMVKTHLLVAVIARDDSPEFSAYWTPPVTNFDAEDAPAQIGRVFDSVTVYPWDAPLVTLPDSAAVHDYLIGRQAPATVAAASRGLPAPLRVTKRGALSLATRSQPDTAAVPGRGDIRRAALRSLPPRRGRPGRARRLDGRPDTHPGGLAMRSELP